MGRKKRYCIILSCENWYGTEDAEKGFFRYVHSIKISNMQTESIIRHYPLYAEFQPSLRIEKIG